MKLIKIGKNKFIKGYSTEEVFRESMKSETFREAYYEELARLRLVRQIRETRIQKKLTQEAVAKQTKMSQSVIARIESGRHGFSLDTLNTIARVLGKEVQLV